MAGNALITGASRGIGAATAIMAAERGYRVCINYASNEAAANDVATTIRKAGGEAIIVQADMGVEADVLRLFETCDKELGAITALVNNAGILDQEGRLEDFSTTRVERIIAVNVTGALIAAREAVRRMSTAKGGNGGSIVNISSMAAVLGGGNTYVDYAASKGAIDALTIGLSREVAENGIRVNAIRPGIVETEIHASGGNPDRVAKNTHIIPMQRGGTPQEVAEAVCWLLSDAASYCTGTFINVSGGR